MNKMKSNRFWLFFIRYFYKKIFILFILTFIIILGVIASNINPFVYGKIIDAINFKQLVNVKMYIVLYFGANLLTLLIGMLESYIGQIFTYQIGSNVKQNVFSKIIRMRFKNLEKYSTGELISRLDSDANVVVEYYINLITNIALIVFNLFASIYFVFTISVHLSLISILYIPAITMVNFFFRKLFRELEKKQRVYQDDYMSFVNEVFHNIYGLRAYRLENILDKKFVDFIDRKLILIKSSVRLRNIMTGIGQTVSVLFNLIVLYFSAKFIIEGSLTIGNMIAFNMYMGKLYDAVSRILSMNMDAQGVIVSMDRIDMLRNEPDEQTLYKDRLLINGRITGVNINNLCFSYDKELTIENLCMECCEPGLYSIVGKNGSGKSTLFKLIMGFYEYNGQIIFTTDMEKGKYNIAEIGLESLRKKVMLISKDVFILSDTLLYNLKIANPLLTDNEIIDMCNEIGYSTFVETLPEQYETILSENGRDFSSGQKQKLNAVRAYISCADVILLDEVTSDLDGIAEMEIVNLIKVLSKTKIVLFISHKITSVMDSKCIYVFDEGKVSTCGSHFEMIEQSELYSELFCLDKSERTSCIGEEEASWKSSK